MNVSDQLLDKYFKNKCTPEEKLQVENYLRNIDELPEHLAKKEEWDDAQDFSLSNEKSDRLFDEIRRQTFGKKKQYTWLKATSIAATVLLLIFIGIDQTKKPKNEQQTVKNSAVKTQSANQVNWKSFVNYTDDTQEIILPDQSVAKINPGAELRYAIPFVREKREIFLVGKGYFQVTKDKKHPFVVYANGISTTALGTSFTITANPQSKIIKVQLHTGKIWVRDIDSISKKSLFSKILLPGNSLVFNRIKNELKIILPNTATVKMAPKMEYNFTQAPLVDVFAKLSEHYKIKIIYNPEELSEMSFTGILNTEKPINITLTELAELNKLTIEKVAEGYLIKK